MTKAALLWVLIAVASCGTASTSTVATAPNVIAGAASCVLAERQDLSFSGYLSGHVTCSRAPAQCIRANGNLGGDIGLTDPIAARIGTSTVQLLVIFEIDPVQQGTYAAGSIGDESASSQTGVTLDGIGHWQTESGGGTMSITTYDPTSAAGAVSATLVSGARSFRVNGTWSCARAAQP